MYKSWPFWRCVMHTTEEAKRLTVSLPKARVRAVSSLRMQCIKLWIFFQARNLVERSCLMHRFNQGKPDTRLISWMKCSIVTKIAHHKNESFTTKMNRSSNIGNSHYLVPGVHFSRLALTRLWLGPLPIFRLFVMFSVAFSRLFSLEYESNICLVLAF